MSSPFQFPTPYINPAILTSAATLARSRHLMEHDSDKNGYVSATAR